MRSLFYKFELTSLIIQLSKYLYNWKFIYVLVLVIAGAISEFTSIFAIATFLNILSGGTEILSKFVLLNKLNTLINSENLLVFASLFLATTVTVASGIRLYSLKISNLFAANIGTQISNKYFKSFIKQKFDSFLLTSESELVNNVTNYAESVVHVIKLLLQLVTGLFVAIAIIFGILLINPQIAFLSIFILPFSFYFITFNSRRKLSINGVNIAKKTQQHVNLVKDVYGSFRDILLTDSIKSYSGSFRNIDREIRITRANSSYLALIPRYILEPFFIILLTIFLLSRSSTNNLEAITLVGTLAFASQRLLPSCQLIFSSYAGIKTHRPSCLKLLQSIYNLESQERIKLGILKTSSAKPINFRLENIFYRYPNASYDSLSNINIEVEEKKLIGITGKSGEGKSTLLDIIMGLLYPNSGNFYINNKKVIKNEQIVSRWVRFIAHVPQRIYLLDGTIEQNILFGSAKSKREKKLIDTISKVALLDDIVPSNDDWHQYKVGFNGSKLSGGQRQRIAIARALMLQKPILILDEATAALDKKTELKIIKNIRKYFKEMTIIAVSHSEDFLDQCDQVYKIEKGRII